jgi:hypothetical protein
LSWSQEWSWAAVVVAAPVIIFAAFEMMRLLRQRRFDALAHRAKEPRRPSSGGKIG